MDDKLLLTLVAAGFTFLGALLSQIVIILLYYFEVIHKRRVMLREKFEQFVFHFQDSLKFYKHISSFTSLDDLLAYEISDASQRAIAIALLYFPEFVPDLEKYITIQLKYYELALTSFNPEIQANAGGQALKHQKLKNRQIDNELNQIKNCLLDMIKSNSKKYAMA